MVELPWDDAKTDFEKWAGVLDSFNVEVMGDPQGALASVMRERAEALNLFMRQTAQAVLEHPAEFAGKQHSEDEQLRDSPSPAEVKKAEEQAERLTKAAQLKSTISPVPALMAQAAVEKADGLRHQRDAARMAHANASVANAPMFQMSPPPLSSSGVPLSLTPHGGSGDRLSGNKIVAGPPTVPQGGGASAPFSGGASAPFSGGASLGAGSPISDTEIGTSTTADGLMAGGMPQAGMMGTPMQPQQPAMPSMGGTGMGAGGVPGGMLGTPGATGAAGARSPKKRDPRDISTGLTGAAGGAAAVVGGAAVAGAGDRGATVTGVTTKADTSGLGTQLSGASGKPGGAEPPRGNMMRGGMMGGGMMGGMGSGAQGGSNLKPRGGEGGIFAAEKDRDLLGHRSVEDAIQGGIIGRDSSSPEVLDDEKSRQMNPDDYKR